MSKYEGYTPGPWKRVFTEAERLIIEGNPEDGSAEVCEINDSWVGVTAFNANARLIADAPMLAERVEEQEDIINRYAKVITEATRKVSKLAEQNAKMLDMLIRVSMSFHTIEEKGHNLSHKHEYLWAEMTKLITEVEGNENG